MQALDSKLSLDTAMALYGLEHSELFWEKALDTKLLMAWNKHTIVLAFRGTASFANALADLQVRPNRGFYTVLSYRGSKWDLQLGFRGCAISQHSPLRKGPRKPAGAPF